MSDHSTSTSGIQASFSEARKRRTQHPNMATAAIASGSVHRANQTSNTMNEESSNTRSVNVSDEQPLLPKSTNLASEEAKKMSKSKPPMLNLSIRNVYYTHSPSGKSVIGSPAFPSTCDLM